MHIPAAYLVSFFAICSVSGFVIAWLWRGNIILAALAGTLLVFLGQVLFHLAMIGTNVFDSGGPFIFYAIISAVGLVPALIGAVLGRMLKRKVSS